MTTENTQPKVDDDGFLATDTPVVDAASIESGAPANDPTAPAPKKRGRKSNAERAAMAAEQIESGGAAPKTAAKKTGSGRKSYQPSDIAAMSKQLQGLHQMAAIISGIPVLQIRPDEGDMLAAAIVNVSEQYDLSIDGKTGALIQILGAAAMIYVPRFGMVMAMSKQAKAQRKAAADGGLPETTPQN